VANYAHKWKGGLKAEVISWAHIVAPGEQGQLSQKNEMPATKQPGTKVANIIRAHTAVSSERGQLSGSL